jgi:hypothetical protein
MTRPRELITVTVLACLQTLPQLRSHTAAALNVGVQPVEIREAMYQLAPFIGFPRTLNAVAAVNEVFRERGITLPLPAQGTVPAPSPPSVRSKTYSHHTIPTSDGSWLHLAACSGAARIRDG